VENLISEQLPEPPRRWRFLPFLWVKWVFRFAAAGALGVLAGFCEQAKGQFLSREHPVTSDEVKIGMSVPESGRIGGIGAEVRQGCAAYIAKVNREGGVAGRRLMLIDYDDRDEPIDTVANVEHLVDRDKVFALLDFYGTPTLQAIMPMVDDSNMILFGPICGSPFLAKPTERLIFWTRPSYEDEAELLVSHLVTDLSFRRIAVFRQDDIYGDEGKTAVVEALMNHGLSLQGDCTYVPSSVEAQDAAYQMAKMKPEAVIMFGSYKPCANFVREAKQFGLTKTVFCAVSTVGTELLIKYLANDSEGVVISQVVPSPNDDSLPLVRDYQEDMRATGSVDFTYMGLEGYINCVAFVAGLRQVGRDLTEDALVYALDHLTIDFRALKIQFSPDARVASHKVFLTAVEHDRAVPVARLKLPGSAE
jgi:branched-chain amino acid transport system substrate-binding protein